MDSLQLTLKLGKTLLAQQRPVKFQLAKLQFQAQQSVVSVESLPEQRGAKSDGIQEISSTLHTFLKKIRKGDLKGASDIFHASLIHQCFGLLSR